MTKHLHGCEQCGVQAPLTKDGKFGENYCIDRPRLKVLVKEKVSPGAQETGGPSKRGAPPASAVRGR